MACRAFTFFGLEPDEILNGLRQSREAHKEAGVSTPPIDQAELAALRLILSNVVARLAVLEGPTPDAQRDLLSSMRDTCQLAAERYSGSVDAERPEFIRRMLKHIDEFFKAITIT